MSDKRDNPLQFLASSFSTLKTVDWPSGKEGVQYTGIILLFVVIAMALVFGFDAVASEVFDVFYG